jgi:hypothetical protein
MRMIFNKVSISESGINANHSQLNGRISFEKQDDGVVARNWVLATLQKVGRLGGQAAADVNNMQESPVQDGGKYVSTHLFGILCLVCI